MGRMAESGVVAVLLPAVPLLSMEEGFANARKMIEMDIPVALATDLNPNCWVTSMQTVISLACYKMRMTPEEAIAASTINARGAIIAASSASPNCSNRPNTLRSIGSCQMFCRESK